MSRNEVLQGGNDVIILLDVVSQESYCVEILGKRDLAIKAEVEWL